MSINWLTNRMPSRREPKLPILENIHVAAPCPADWNKMLGNNRVRHCGECNLNVYNLSEMTRKEAERLVRNHEGRLCVRFYRRADGTILTQNCPIGLKALVRRVSRMAGTMVAACMSIGSAIGQNAVKSGTQSHTQDTQSTTGLDLTVVDPASALIPGAKVLLCHCKNHGTVTINTDATGLAHFTGLKPGSYSLEIQATGFKPSRQNIKIEMKKIASLQLKLQIAPTSATVEVAGSPATVQGAMMGILSSEKPAVWPPVAGGTRPAPLR